jgi:hypothetical protein
MAFQFNTFHVLAPNTLLVPRREFDVEQDNGAWPDIFKNMVGH